MTVRDEALIRYEAAVARREAIEAEWIRAGEPLLADNRGVPYPHPLVKMLEDADKLCDRLLKTVRPARPVGRPAGSASAPDRQPKAPPRVKLKAVG